MRIITDLFAYCSGELPRFNTISISGYHMREAGATAAQEIAFTLADGIAYVQAAIDAGLEVDDFAPRLSFFFACHMNFFEEVAKFRAARRLWARIMTERFGASEKNAMLRFHTQTGGATLTAQQPQNNIVRTTLEALAAVLGGTQSLHTNSWDEALALPSEKAARLALRTQQVIAHESGVPNTVDPMGGSFFVEALTRETEEDVYAYFHRIEDLGGVLPAIETGYMQREISDAAYQYQREIDTRERVIVGVNEYALDEPLEIPILEMDPQGYERQVERLRRLRRERDNREATRCLKALETACRGQENVMPYLLDAVNAYCTLGETCDVMRGVFGEYKEDSVV